MVQVHTYPDVVIILVRGTKIRARFRKLPLHRKNRDCLSWTAAGSRFRSQMLDALGHSVHFVRFPWTGKNSLAGRKRGSQDLAALVLECRREFPHSRIYVIAHSHGGSIAWMALQRDDVTKAVNGLVCLATPFLSFRRTTLDVAPEAYTTALSTLLTLLVSPLIVAIFTLPLSQPLLWILLGIAIIIPSLRLGFNRLATWFLQLKEAAEAKFGTVNVPLQHPPATLLIRASEDEAAGLLSTAQFVNWSISRVCESTVNYSIHPRIFLQGADAYMRKRLTESSFRPTLVAVSVSTILLTIALFMRLPPKLSGFMFVFPAVILVIRELKLLSAVSFGLKAVAGSALLVLTILGRALILKIFFGTDLAKYSLFLEVAVDPSPVGALDFVQLEPATPEFSRSSFLVHSLYDHPSVPKIIADWVNAKS